jgi:hypothetical protein
MIRWLLDRWRRWRYPGWALILAGCGAAQHVPECDGKSRHALTAELAADLAECGDDAECIDDAEVAHDKRREAWVRCEP